MKNQICAAQCPKCLDLIISGSQHDYHSCSCNEIAIDGGLAYTRLAYKVEPPTVVHIILDGLTNKDIYDEWNYRKPKKYRLIKSKERVYKSYSYILNKAGQIVGKTRNKSKL